MSDNCHSSSRMHNGKDNSKRRRSSRKPKPVVTFAVEGQLAELSKLKNLQSHDFSQQVFLFVSWLEGKFGTGIIGHGPITEVGGEGVITQIQTLHNDVKSQSFKIHPNFIHKAYKQTLKNPKPVITDEDADRIIEGSFTWSGEHDVSLLRSTRLLVSMGIVSMVQVDAILRYSVNKGKKFALIMPPEFPMHRGTMQDAVNVLIAIAPDRIASDTFDLPCLETENPDTRTILYSKVMPKASRSLVGSKRQRPTTTAEPAKRQQAPQRILTTAPKTKERNFICIDDEDPGPAAESRDSEDDLLQDVLNSESSRKPTRGRLEHKRSDARCPRIGGRDGANGRSTKEMAKSQKASKQERSNSIITVQQQLRRECLGLKKRLANIRSELGEEKARSKKLRRQLDSALVENNNLKVENKKLKKAIAVVQTAVARF